MPEPPQGTEEGSTESQALLTSAEQEVQALPHVVADSTAGEPALISPTVLPSARKANEDTVTLLQEWEGVVSSPTEKGTFVAVLRDRTNPSNSEERARLPLDEVPQSDRQLVVPGAVFYWSIAYWDSPSGSRRTVSTLRFRRLPRWSRRDIRRLEVDAARFKKLFEDSKEPSR